MDISELKVTFHTAGLQVISFNILVDCIDLFLDEGIVPAVLPGRVDQSAVREVEDILVLLGEAHRAALGRVELRHLTITSEDENEPSRKGPFTIKNQLRLYAKQGK